VSSDVIKASASMRRRCYGVLVGRWLRGRDRGSTMAISTALVVLYSPALCKHCGDKNGNLPNQSLRRIDVAELDR
jgi:hypothetical protein